MSTLGVARCFPIIRRLFADNGSYYLQACGPRSINWDEMTYDVWKQGYSTGWFEYDHELIESYASLLKKLSEQKGGCADASTRGCKEKWAADAWFLRFNESSNPTIEDHEQAAPFTYQVCRLMRESDGSISQNIDFGPSYSWFNADSVEHVTGSYLYSQCKRWKHEAYGELGRAVHDLAYEISACSTSPVDCKKVTANH